MGGFHAYVNLNTYPSLSSNTETLCLHLLMPIHNVILLTLLHPFCHLINKLKKNPNLINKKFLKYEPTNHNPFRFSSLSKNYSMCIQHFQKTGETDGFLLSTLGINGRLPYTSKYLLCGLLFLVLLEWVHLITYGHYLWPKFLCWHKLKWCGKGKKQTYLWMCQVIWSTLPSSHYYMNSEERLLLFSGF